MAKIMGYKEKITWETIQKPYMPKGLVDNIIQQQQYQSAQLDIMNLASNYFQNMKNERDNRKKIWLKLRLR